MTDSQTDSLPDSLTDVLTGKSTDDMPDMNDPDALVDWLTRPDDRPVDRTAILRRAVAHGDWLIAEAQLLQGANPFACDEHGFSAINSASPQMARRIIAFVSENHSRRVKALHRHRRGPQP